MTTITTRRTKRGEPRWLVHYFIAASGGNCTRTFADEDAALDFAASLQPDAGPPAFRPAGETDGDWRLRAACRGMSCADDDIWFERDETRPGPARKTRVQRRRDTEVALAFCGICEVVAECLDMALVAELGAPFAARSGIFGGTTPVQRDRIARARRAS